MTSLAQGNVASQGSHSLQMLVNPVATDTISAEVMFCGGAQNLVGKSFHAKVRLETSATDTSVYVHAQLVAGGTEGGGLGQTLLEPGVWTTIDDTFNDGFQNHVELLGAATHFGFAVIGAVGFTGNIYIDAVSID